MLPNLRDLCIGLHGVFRVTILQRLAVCMVDINRAIGNLKQQINVSGVGGYSSDLRHA
jgi:hypothetical protein